MSRTVGELQNNQIHSFLITTMNFRQKISISNKLDKEKKDETIALLDKLSEKLTEIRNEIKE